VATVITFLIIAANCVVIYFVSFLAVGGDGSSVGVSTVRIAGFTWVAVAAVFALYQCSKEKGSVGVLITTLTLPVAYLVVSVATMAWSATQHLLIQIEPVPPQIAEVCKSGGPKFLNVPSSPIHSIAFIWDADFDRARFSYLNKDSRKFGRFRFLEDIEFPHSVGFMERRFFSGVGVSADEHRPYMRRPNGGVFVGAAELTADALVSYEFIKLSKPKARNAFELTDITVTDRRNGQVLATLRYPVDAFNSPMCGETSPGEVNIAEFIFKAIGAVPK